MTNLLLHVTPELQVSEGALKVAFFDREIIKFKHNDDPDAPKKILSKEPKLHIRIENKQDGFSIIERPAVKVRLISQFGDRFFKDEKDIYKTAYARYLDLKSRPSYNPESELEAARKRIAELEAKAKVEVKEEVEEDLKEEFKKTKK